MIAAINIPVNVTGDAQLQLSEIMKKFLFIGGLASGRITPAFKRLTYQTKLLTGNLYQLTVRMQQVTDAFMFTGSKHLTGGTLWSEFGLDDLTPINKVHKAVKRFDMQMLGLGLSVMFAGMALQRAFGGALRSLFANYKMIGDEQSTFNVKTNELNASWTFLKFSIIEALSQSGLFSSFIDWVINIIEWFSTLINKFPAIGTGLVVAFSVLAGTGAVMAILGQFITFWAGTVGVRGTLFKTASKGLGTVAGESGSVAGAVKTSYLGWQSIIGAGLLIYGLFNTYTHSSATSPTPFGTIIKNVLATGIGAAFAFKSLGAGILASTVILVGIIITEEGKANLAHISNILSTPDIQKNALESYLYGREKGQGTFVPEYAKTGIGYTGEIVTQSENNAELARVIGESVRLGTTESLHEIFGIHTGGYLPTPYTG